MNDEEDLGIPWMIDDINITKGDDENMNDEEFVERPSMIDGIDITEGDYGTMNNKEHTSNPLIINRQDKNINVQVKSKLKKDLLTLRNLIL